MSYDLMLQTHPNRELAANSFDAIQEEIAHNATLPRLCELTLGRRAASSIDVIVLREGLDFGDFSEQDFNEFCSRRGLTADCRNQDSAAAFIGNRWGFTVATLKLPKTEEEARTAYVEIVEFALRHGLRVTDPQSGRDIDLQKPGLLPQSWNS
ncbi:MAG TPA: hypothetical protein VFZ59_18900 [Verrucomicrobiae bacterium]|nr:hypothetical protein [Verrucomicrobiae bacterium]